MDLSIRTMPSDPGQQPVEVVERKGLGHPDTICDALAEEVSRALCRHYVAEFGIILHHNVDKVLLVGGSATAGFDGGDVTAPIEIYLGGRATKQAMGRKIPVDEIAVDACKRWLTAHLRCLDVERHVRVISRIGSGSQDLTALFARGQETPFANDTSCGVGFAPLTELERTVLDVEHALTSTETRTRHPAMGEDVKVMGVRREGRVTLTVACAFVARHVHNLGAYSEEKQKAALVALNAARAASSLDVEVRVNPGDRVEQGEIYLTVTGTSAECGDDGEVGRGNRANGLITPHRPMTMEASAGKNPVNHVGKLYHFLAGNIASALCSEVPPVRGAACLLVSQIGRPVADPQLADLALVLQAPFATAELREGVASLVHLELSKLSRLREQLVRGELTPY